MNRLRDKIPVEPLSAENYARIEDRVAAAYEGVAYDLSSESSFRQRPGRWWRGLAPVAAIAGVLLLVYVGWRVLDERPAPTMSPAVHIVTDDAGVTRHQLGDAEIAVERASEVALWQDLDGAAAGTVHVDLTRGAVVCEVAPKDGRKPFIVHAGEVDVTVVGTLFRVERPTPREVRVLVTRGQVRVDSPDGRFLVSAGEEWSSRAPIAQTDGANAGRRDPSDRRSGATDPADERDGTGADERASGSGDGDADRSSRTGALALGARTNGTGKLDGRSARVPTAARSAADKRVTPNEKKSRRRTSKRSSTAKKPASETDRALARARPERGQAPADDSGLQEIAAIEVDDPATAIERYRKAAFGRGAPAEYALYSVAYLQYMQLGQRADALATLERYERRFARGRHMQAALWLRTSILCRGDGRQACRAAAHSYLGRFPRGKHAELARRIIDHGM